MQSTDIQCAIMFADIAGSTQIYETYGNTLARSGIAQCLEEASEIVVANKGSVIKTIGDEIMCRFPSASEATQAACEVHEAMRDRTYEANMTFSMRIGIDFGAAVLDKGDVFGDVVNMATRMTEIARAGQIITTQTAVDTLTEEQRGRLRAYDDHATIKGKQDTVTVYEVLWEDENVTQMLSRAEYVKQLDASHLDIIHGDEIRQISADIPSVTLGRAPNCNIIISNDAVSRVHARIEFRRGKFVLIDQSTNGTYVKIEDNDGVYIRREEIHLWGSGYLSLGEDLDTASEHSLRFVSK